MSLRRACLTAAALVAVVTTGLATPTGASADPPSADPLSALPAVCTSPTTPNVYSWVGGSADHDWENPANWQHVHNAAYKDFPQDDTNHDGEPDRNDTIVCIPDLGHYDHVFIRGPGSQTGFVWVAELHAVGDFEIQLQANNSGLLINGTNPSSLGPDTSVDLRGTFGGRATIHSAGDITATSFHGACPPGTTGTGGVCTFPVQLTSHKIGRGPEVSYGTGAGQTAGKLVIDASGSLTFTDRGAGLSYDYRLEVAGTVTLAAATGAEPATTPYLAASDGTRVDIVAGGTLAFAGNGGLLQGMDFAGQSPPPLTNAGTIEKTGPGTTSLVDIAYQPQPTGVVHVVSGDLLLPDGETSSLPVTADVATANSFGTGTCGVSVNPEANAPSCTATTNPALDKLSVAMTAPSTQDLAGVTVDEAAPSSDVLFDHPGPVVRVDIDDFQVAGVHVTPDRAHPARAELRYSKSYFAAGTGQSGLQLVRSPLATSARTVLHDCAAAGVVNAGEQSCIDRAASTAATAAAPGNLVLVVNTIDSTDSRYIIRVPGTDVGVTALFSGQVQVGKTVSVTLGLDPQPDLDLHTIWTLDDVPVPGSEEQTSITLTPTMVDKNLGIAVSASATDWDTASVTVDDGVVQPGTFADGAGPQVSAASVVVNTPVRVSPNGWTSPTAVTVQWLRASDGLLLKTATCGQPAGAGCVLEYVPTVVGDIRARTIGSRPGYTPVTRDSGVVHVVGKAPMSASTVTISGKAKVGKTLRASVTYPHAVSTLTYAWFRVKGSSRTAVGSAATYKLTNRDRGCRIQLRVTASSATYEDTQGSYSALTAKVTKKKR